MIGIVQRLVDFPRQLWWYVTSRPFDWVEPHRLAACRYPRSQSDLNRLARNGVSLVMNLHLDRHPESTCSRYGFTELHLPVADFTPPTPDQIDKGVETIVAAIDGGQTVAVHCGAGLGRTGALLACYLVRRGMPPDAAIARIRSIRPGSVETVEQVDAIYAYARRISSPAHPTY